MNLSLKLFALGACLLVLFLGISCANINTSTGKNVSKIAVSGSSSIELKADMAKYTVQVSELADTTREALEKTNTKIAQILGILKKNGIEDDCIKTGDYSISTQYSWTDGKQNRIGERVMQSLQITVKDLSVLAPLIDSLSAVSGISVYSLTFDVSDKTEALQKARELAYADAKEKAEIYCKSSGTKIVKPILINESYSTYNPRSVNEDAFANGAMAMKAVALSANTELPSGGVNVQVNLQCEFEIK